VVEFASRASLNFRRRKHNAQAGTKRKVLKIADQLNFHPCQIFEIIFIQRDDFICARFLGCNGVKKIMDASAPNAFGPCELQHRQNFIG
jgi:hypothetical protein